MGHFCLPEKGSSYRLTIYDDYAIIVVMEKFNNETQHQISMDDYSFEERDDRRTDFDAAEGDRLVADCDYKKYEPIDPLYHPDIIRDNPRSKDLLDIAENIANKMGCSINEAKRYVANSEDREEPVYSEKELNELKDQKTLEYIDSQFTDAPSVGLKERREATQEIMKIFNKLNKHKGSFSESAQKKMQGRYDNVELNNIVIGSNHVDEALKLKIGQYIDVLMGGSEVAKEFPSERARLEKDLENRYGVGHAYEDDRKKLVKSLYVPKPIKVVPKEK